MKIKTFGYRYPRTELIGADLIFDARCLKEDPAEKQALGALTGQDLEVKRYLARLPDVTLFLHVSYAGVASYLLDHIDPETPLTVVAIGCHSGRHRSVYLAESIAQLLRQHERIDVEVEHLDMLRHADVDMAPDCV